MQFAPQALGWDLEGNKGPAFGGSSDRRFSVPSLRLLGVLCECGICGELNDPPRHWSNCAESLYLSALIHSLSSWPRNSPSCGALLALKPITMAMPTATMSAIASVHFYGRE